MTPMPDITTCPLCGSKRITKVKRTLTRRSHGKSYLVPDLEFHECASCGERFFDRAASRKIDQASPAFPRRARRKSA